MTGEASGPPHAEHCPGCRADLLTAEDTDYLRTQGWTHPGHELALAVGVRVGQRRAERVLADLARHLLPGEQVIRLVKSLKVIPVIDLVALTDRRILAFAVSDLRGAGPCRVAAGADIREVDGRTRIGLTSLRVTLHGGKEVILGQLEDDDVVDVLADARNLVARCRMSEARRAEPDAPRDESGAERPGPDVRRLPAATAGSPAATVDHREDDRLDRLERVGRLLHDGVIDREQAARLSREILGD